MSEYFTIAEKLSVTEQKHAIDAVVQKILEGYLILGEDSQIVLDIQPSSDKNSVSIRISVKDIPLQRVLDAYAGLCRPVQFSLPFKDRNT